MMGKDRLFVASLQLLICLAMLLTFHRSGATGGFNFPAKDFGENVTKLLDSLLANYDRRLRPGYGSGPTTIQVNMNVRSMGPFSEKEESYAMQLYLRQSWTDPRLSFDKHILSGKNDATLSMNWMFANKLWKPDTFFINGKNSYFHAISAPNMFIRLKCDGGVTWSMRLTVRATCLMHLRKFPLDTQQCPLTMASYGYNLTDIRYQWDPSQNVQVSPDVSIAQYELINIKESNDTVSVRDKVAKHYNLLRQPTNKNSCSSAAEEGCSVLQLKLYREKISTLSVKFYLRRQTGFFLLQVYIPCILIVCCSWVAFWITKKDAPGRVCLGVTTVLSMTTLGLGGQTAPPVSYATALDYFVILCFVFVFAAVLEYAFINFFERAANKRRKKMENLKSQIAERITAAASGGTMIVTTTMEVPKHDVTDSLRQIFKIPLVALPAADDDSVIEITDIAPPHPGHTEEGLKNLLKVPLTVLPESPEAISTSDAIRKESVRAVSSAVSEKLSKAKAMTMKKLKARRRRKAPEVKEKGDEPDTKRGEQKPPGQETKADKVSPSVIVDVSGEDSPPEKEVTIWELLMKKQKLMCSITPYFVIPPEEEVLDTFAIVDYYSRRIFPSLFFFFIAIYWILFTYYITDEFPEDFKQVSDGLVIT